MKTIALLLLLPALALGQDAPTLNPHAPGRSLHFVAGEITPFAGQLIEDTEHARREWDNERTAGELAKLKTGTTLPTPVLISLLGATGAAVATAIVLGVAMAAKRPAP